MKYINNKNIENGYAILFTIVVVSIISIISMGLASSALKQMILSGVARDSTTAFYEADLGSECALYAENAYNMVPPTNPWICAGNSLSFTGPTDAGGGKTTYTLNPDGTGGTNDKCFRITATKEVVGDTINTKIQTRGYNICDMGNSRTVERAIEITY
jgi:Tfp pilus assembly protein PilX